MIIAGIDPDTKAITISYVGDALVTPDVIRVEAKGRRAEDRVHDLFLALAGSDAFAGPLTWVYVERPMVVRNAKAVIDQAVVVGMIRAVLWSKGVSNHSLVDPGTWKRGLLGNGHASKEEIASYAQNVLNMAAGQKQDAYDAACIAAWGYSNAPKGANT